jgi:hypothetical protein
VAVVPIGAWVQVEVDELHWRTQELARDGRLETVLIYPVKVVLLASV